MEGNGFQIMYGRVSLILASFIIIHYHNSYLDLAS